MIKNYKTPYDFSVIGRFMPYTILPHHFYETEHIVTVIVCMIVPLTNGDIDVDLSTKLVEDVDISTSAWYNKQLL